MLAAVATSITGLTFFTPPPAVAMLYSPSLPTTFTLSAGILERTPDGDVYLGGTDTLDLGAARGLEEQTCTLCRPADARPRFELR